MVVAGGSVRVEAPGMDGDVDTGVLDVRGIELDRASEILEASLDGREHHVLNGEFKRRMIRIDRPRLLGCPDGSVSHAVIP